MVIDPEERRRQREEKKMIRQRQRARMLRILAAVAVLLIAALVLVVAFGRMDNAPTDPTQPATSATDTPPEETEDSSPPETTLPEAEPTVIHFLAGGDLNVTDRVVASGGDSYDYTRAFLDIAPLLASADLTALNFEGNLCSAPYGASASAPQNLAYALSRVGVDMVQLANSYSIHRGVSGLRTTIENFRAAGLEPVGVFMNQEDYRQRGGYTIFQVQGVKVAVVSFTKGMLNGTALPPGNETMVNVLYTDYDSTYQKVNTQKITSVLRSVAEEAPDITIALLHWGSEYNDTIRSSQNSIANLMLQYGVDAIIGTHPHRVQKMVFDQEKGTFIAYSLGDFFSDANKSGSEYSVLLDLEITKAVDGTTTITGYSYTPIFTVAEEEKPLRVLRIREAMAAYESGYIDRVSEETYNAMAYALQRIEARIHAE